MYSDGGAGIGGGNEKDGGTIRITGGEVTSQGGCDAAGIGGRKYRKSFKDTVTKDTAWITTVEIHSPKHYRLTHLLEFGHVVKVKGKVVGAARAYPHLATAETEAEELLGKKIAISVKG